VLAAGVGTHPVRMADAVAARARRRTSIAGMVSSPP
jgi:hypothetical protein